jgi:hypothetical protein
LPRFSLSDASFVVEWRNHTSKQAKNAVGPEGGKPAGATKRVYWPVPGVPIFHLGLLIFSLSQSQTLYAAATKPLKNFIRQRHRSFFTRKTFDSP